jgi:hypothetical protein
VNNCNTDAGWVPWCPEDALILVVSAGHFRTLTRVTDRVRVTLDTQGKVRAAQACSFGKVSQVVFCYWSEACNSRQHGSRSLDYDACIVRFLRRALSLTDTVRPVPESHCLGANQRRTRMDIDQCFDAGCLRFVVSIGHYVALHV